MTLPDPDTFTFDKLPCGTILVFATGKSEVHRIIHLIKKEHGMKARRMRKNGGCNKNGNNSAGAAGPGADEDGQDSRDSESDGDQEDENYELGNHDSEAEEDFDDDLTAVPQVVQDEKEMESIEQTVDSVNVESEAKRAKMGLRGEKIKGQLSKKKKLLQDLKSKLAEDREVGAGITSSTKAGVKRKVLKRKKVDKETTTSATSATSEVVKSASAPETTVIDEEDDEDLLPEDIFQLDKEEDCVDLVTATPTTETQNDDSTHQNATSPSLNKENNKRIQMSKLDRSRTARGLFCGGDKNTENVKLTVLPLYAQLPAREQMRVFDKPQENERRIIVSTNVAETSVTLPNVRFVVDAGYEKKRNFTPSGISSFSVQFISKASADQRAGRSGRVGPGHCYRLYSSACYNDVFTQFPPINVLSVPMDSVLLSMASMGIPDLDKFPWPTPPPGKNVNAARMRLEALGAFSSCSSVGTGENYAATPCNATSNIKKNSSNITTMGRRLVLFPLQPRYSVMLYQALQKALELYGKRNSTAVDGGGQHGSKANASLTSKNYKTLAQLLLQSACLLTAALSTGNVLTWNAGTASAKAAGQADKTKADRLEDGDAAGTTSDMEGVDERPADKNFAPGDDEVDSLTRKQQQELGISTMKRGGVVEKNGKEIKEPDWCFDCHDDMEALLWAMTEVHARFGGKTTPTKGAHVLHGDQTEQTGANSTTSKDNFCITNWINPKQMEEAQNLSGQLLQILKTKLSLPKGLICVADSTTTSSTSSPKMSASGKIKAATRHSFRVLKQHNIMHHLRATILAGLVDKIARQSVEKPKLYELALQNPNFAQQNSFTKVNAALHISSRLLKERPHLLCYVDLQSSVCGRTGKQKFFLSGCMAVDTVELSRLNLLNLAISDGRAVEEQHQTRTTKTTDAAFTSPLLSYANGVLAIPTPVLADKFSGKITVHCQPRYLPLDNMLLPTVPNVDLAEIERTVALTTHNSFFASSVDKNNCGGTINDLPSKSSTTSTSTLSSYTGGSIPEVQTLRYRVFAKALLEGVIFPQLKRQEFRIDRSCPMDRILTSKQSELVGTCGLHVADLVQNLVKLGVSSKTAFLEEDRRRNGALRGLYLNCLPKNSRSQAMRLLAEAVAGR